jgi:hypothetical protein
VSNQGYRVCEIYVEDNAPCECGDGCGWKGPAEALLEIEECILNAGDPSPAGRCPECEALAYVL